MRAYRVGGRARIGALLVYLALPSMLTGCALFHRHHREDVGCHQATFNLEADNHLPLQAPAGLNPPDTNAQVKIPLLTAADKPRPKSAPCLDWPPQFVNTPLSPPVRRPTQ